MYLPDGMASFSIKGVNYLITANRTSAPRDRQDDATTEIDPDVDPGSGHRVRCSRMRHGHNAARPLDSAEVDNAVGWPTWPSAAASFARHM